VSERISYEEEGGGEKTCHGTSIGERATTKSNFISIRAIRTLTHLEDGTITLQPAEYQIAKAEITGRHPRNDVEPM